MRDVNIVDQMIERRKKIYASLQYWKFMLTYRELPERLKQHFLGIYINFLLVWANEKIKQLLSNPLKSWIDKKGLLPHISNILEYMPDYDFSSYNNEDLNNYVEEIRKKQ
jgi:hypothetical protein